MRKRWWVLVLLFMANTALAAEVGLVTAVTGNARLLEANGAAGVAGALKAFVKLHEGDVLTLDGGARVQTVYFDGARQESWQGPGSVQIGTAQSQILKGSPRLEVRILPVILGRQLAKTPAPDGSVKLGMARTRSMPSGGTLESIEKNYTELRKQADQTDRNPELYLLSGYFELREFDKVQGLLKQLGEKAPGDPEVKMLASLYTRAVSNAKMAQSK